MTMRGLVHADRNEPGAIPSGQVLLHAPVRRWHPNGKTVFVWSVLGPLLLLYAGWLYFPIVYSLLMSLYDWNPLLTTGQEFLGLRNYIEAFTQDPVFWTALGNSFSFALWIVPLSAIVALVLALLINSIHRGATLFRTIYFLPPVTSLIAAAVMWNWVYQPQFGLLNDTLRLIDDTFGLNLPTQIGWLTDPRLAMPSVAIFDIWKGAGFGMIIFLAGLQGIPASLYEAAKVDGANRWHLFWKITLPLLQPTTLFVLVMTVIGALQAFGEFFIMTQGGPANATLTMTYLLYNEAFSTNRFGYASALATILFVIILVLTLLQLRLLRLRWEY